MFWLFLGYFYQLKYYCNMKVFFLIVTLLIGISSQSYAIKIRDSQTGALVSSEITLTAIPVENISKKMWLTLRMGRKLELGKFTSTSIQFQSQNHISVPIIAELQILNVSAQNYKSSQTYIEPQQKIIITDLFLDRDSKTANPCVNYPICGFIYDKDSGNPLDKSRIEISNNQHRFIIYSDPYGFFKFNQDIPDNATLVVSHLGYRTQIWNQITLKSSFSMIIDLEQGSGIIEHSMHHPLMDVRDNRVDQKWLQAKLSQSKTNDLPNILERPGGGFYIEPPANVRVGFNLSGGTCCGSSCSTSQVYSLESYVQKGLDNEWIASWNAESLKAGSIPYRSYGAWHVLNPPYSGYDICAGPCCQAFNSTSYTATVNAAKATTGIMLEKNGILARSEYSAQNNAWDDPNDGLSCTNVDLSCGNGFVGSPSTGWSCLSDPSSTDKGCFGHGRGMSQWGTQFNALAGKDFADIVDFYYNANNNPSGERSQYNSSPVNIVNIIISSNTVFANQTMSLDFQIFNANPSSENFGPIMLGASLINNNVVYSDPSNDAVYTLSQTGSNNLTRNFTIPANAQTGVYDLFTAVYLDVNTDNIITAADWALVSLRLTNQITITTLPDLMFTDSFE